MSQQPLLSICIPTWNRADILDSALTRLFSEIQTINAEEIEIYVSDNCSSDHTTKIVQKFIDRGLRIHYNRNSENLGFDGNFLYCIKNASGKYIWLLGDDDFINPGSLAYLLTLLKNHDFGLIHLSGSRSTSFPEDLIIFNDVNDFLKKVSYWITFISGTIFLRRAVALIPCPEKYYGSCILQVPFFIKSATLGKKNAIVTRPILDEGQIFVSNGGYNFYTVFVENYLSIWDEFLRNKSISKECFLFIKRDIFEHFIIPFSYQLLIKRERIASTKDPKGFYIQNAWSILFKHYGKKIIYYIVLLQQLIKKLIHH